MFRLLCLLLLTCLNATACYAGKTTPRREPIAWEKWSDAAFQRAKRENEAIILDLEAVWCHWCHVMDQRTYANPSIAKLIKDHFCGASTLFACRDSLNLPLDISIVSWDF